jgi:hypothetical protein
VKREVHSNHRLVIRPDTRGWSVQARSDHAALCRLLGDMEAAIRRHVDNVGLIHIAWDTREVCSHCEREWEPVTAEDAADPDYAEYVVGEPMCCDAASKEFRAERDASGGGS